MWHYTSVSDALTGVAFNFPPILIVFLLNLLIVFRLIKVRNLKLKICLDLVVSLFAACIVNWGFLYIIGAFRSTKVDWAGTVLNDIIILLGG